MLIQVGSTEALLDDATRIAQRAKAAGVEVSLDIGELWVINTAAGYANCLPFPRNQVSDFEERVLKQSGQTRSVDAT